MQLLDQKAHANTYEEAKQIKRSLTEVVGESNSHNWLGNESYDAKTIVEHIGTMSQTDVDKYTTPKPPEVNPYRSSLDQFVATKLAGAEQLEAKRLLEKVSESGKPPVPDSVDNLLIAKIKGAEPETILALSEKALADSALRQRLNQPEANLSADDKQLKAQIQDASMRLALRNTSSANADDGLFLAPSNAGPSAEDINNALFQNGSLPTEIKLELGISRN